MRVHLAGRICQRDNFTGQVLTIPQKVLIEEGYPCSLVTYAYEYDTKIWSPVWKATPEQHVIIDSGAFTAFNQGMKLTTAGLADYIKRFRVEHSYLASMSFMSLDVIGDQAASWRNFDDLERRGLDVMPVLSGAAATKADVDRAAEYPYIAVGDLTSGERQREILDFIFGRLLKRREVTGHFPKVHMLGLTQEWACRRYPAFSCDSSSWLRVVRYGLSRLPGTNRKVPSYGKGAAATAGVKEQIRAEVRHYRKLATDAEKLWARRGFTWD